MADTNATKAFRIEPYAYAEARELADALDVSDPVAITLVRRGYRTVDDAREFLDASVRHDPFEFESMQLCVERILAAAQAGRRITIHGDYDVDGVCSTAILVGALRELGASCDWMIPDRFSDGYGLTEATIAKLAARGTELLVTTDCGITSAAEVAVARAAGIEVIVTDHHAPADELPDCPIVHPRVSGYPCADLCATGVAYKVASALRHRAGASGSGGDERDLDLVALATVADMVPLTGENRALVRAGLDEARRAQRPGLRALMAAAAVEPSRLDEGDLAFRLAPRINAAGRLYRADAGVELMLCADADRAAGIAAELDRANHERRDAEIEVLAAAEKALRDQSATEREAQALVLAGEGWHPGVVGIVASRLAERHYRPVILISLDAAGRGRGSGRSIPSFDLLGALRRCAEHLTRFGGHRAAAGIEIEPGRIDDFRRAFVACAAQELEPGDLVRTDRVDAVVPGDRLGLRVAEELERLGPFGIGNPGVRLLVPAARVEDVRPMGDEGKHARFSIASGAARALGVAFGSGTSIGPADGGPVDAAVRLEVNQWNGSVAPRVVLRDLYPIAERNGDGDAPVEPCVTCAACPPRPADEAWWARVRAEVRSRLSPWPPVAPPGRRPRGASASSSPPAARSRPWPSSPRAGRRCSGSAPTSRGATSSPAAPTRRASAAARSRSSAAAAAAIQPRAARGVLDAGGLALADWAALARDPGLGARLRPRRAGRPAAVRPPRDRDRRRRGLRPRRLGRRARLRAQGARVRVGSAAVARRDLPRSA